MSDDQQQEISSRGSLAPAEQRTPVVRREGVIAISATAMGALALGAIAMGRWRLESWRLATSASVELSGAMTKWRAW